MEAWRTLLATLAAGLALAACTPQASAPPGPAAPAVSYDGLYTGTVALTNVGAGVTRAGCATDPHLSLQVSNNSFTYSQPHPNAPPGSAAIYSVIIAPNGTMTGQSQVSGTMTGNLVGSHMAGIIDGIECVYSFTADRN